MRDISFKKRLMILYMILMGVIIILLTFSVSYFTYRNLEETATESLILLTEKTSDQLDLFIRNTNEKSLQVLGSPLIRMTMKELSAYPNKENNFESDYYLRTENQDLLLTIVGPSFSVFRINVFNYDGDFVSFGKMSTDSNIVQETIKKQTWYDDLVAKRGKFMILPPQEDQWSKYKSGETISLVRTFNESNVVYGFIEVQQQFTDIEEIVRKGMQDEGTAYVIDNEGKVIYPLDGIDQRHETGIIGFWEGNKKHLEKDSVKISRMTLGEERVLVSYNYSGYTGWTTVYMKAEKDVFKPVNIITAGIVLVGILVMGLSFIITYIITERVTKPLRQLTTSIKNVTIDNTDIDISGLQQNNELLVLSEAFNDMVDRLKRSTDQVIQIRSREMNANYVALMAQMNPHFLYNILSVMGSAARQGENDKIAEMCALMGEMLRYISLPDIEGVSIRDELMHTKNYIDLMKYRYEDRLEFNLNMNDELLDIRISKLMIQPLVENCFKHAFQKVRPPWKITIDGHISNGNCVIQIADNGAGFDKEAYSVMKQKMDSFDSDYEKGVYGNKLRIGGMAIINIYQRMRFRHGESAIFDIADSIDGGTCITIGYPIDNIAERD